MAITLKLGIFVYLEPHNSRHLHYFGEGHALLNVNNVYLFMIKHA